MFTILENIFKNDSGDKINSLNKSFFNKYLDQEIILKLIDIRKLYIDILTFEKSKEKDIRTRDILKKELDYYINKMEKMKYDISKYDISDILNDVKTYCTTHSNIDDENLEKIIVKRKKKKIKWRYI